MENLDVFIKKGRYGLYIEYGETRISIKNADARLETFTMEDMKECIKPTKEKSVLRELNEHMDIRRGQYGAYVYYKTPEMKKPKFLNIKKCPHGFLNCTVETLVEWLCTTYNLPTPP